MKYWQIIAIVGVWLATGALGYLVGREHVRYRTEMQSHGIEKSLLELQRAHQKAQAEHETWVAKKEQEVLSIANQMDQVYTRLGSAVALTVEYFQRVRNKELMVEEAIRDLYQTARVPEFAPQREEVLTAYDAWLAESNQTFQSEIDRILSEVRTLQDLVGLQRSGPHASSR